MREREARVNTLTQKQSSPNGIVVTGDVVGTGRPCCNSCVQSSVSDRNTPKKRRPDTLITVDVPAEYSVSVSDRNTQSSKHPHTVVTVDVPAEYSVFVSDRNTQRSKHPHTLVTVDVLGIMCPPQTGTHREVDFHTLWSLSTYWVFCVRLRQEHTDTYPAGHTLWSLSTYWVLCVRLRQKHTEK